VFLINGDFHHCYLSSSIVCFPERHIKIALLIKKQSGKSHFAVYSAVIRNVCKRHNDPNHVGEVVLKCFVGEVET
jgi:hypothetical protein